MSGPAIEMPSSAGAPNHRHPQADRPELPVSAAGLPKQQPSQHSLYGDIAEAIRGSENAAFVPTGRAAGPGGHSSSGRWWLLASWCCKHRKRFCNVARMLQSPVRVHHWLERKGGASPSAATTPPNGKAGLDAPVEPSQRSTEYPGRPTTPPGGPAGSAARRRSATDREQRGSAPGAVALPTGATIGEGDLSRVGDSDFFAADTSTLRSGIRCLWSGVDHAMSIFAVG